MTEAEATIRVCLAMLMILMVVPVILLGAPTNPVKQLLKDMELQKKINGLMDSTGEYTPHAYFALQREYEDQAKVLSYAGCYVIKDMADGSCYVGSSANVPIALWQEFRSSDSHVIAGRKSGHHFRITTYRSRSIKKEDISALRAALTERYSKEDR